MTKISRFIEFTQEQKEPAATIDLKEFLLQQGKRQEPVEQKSFAPPVPNANTPNACCVSKLSATREQSSTRHGRIFT